MQLHRVIGDARRGVRNRLFGNNHSVAVNLRYANYHRACKSAWRPNRPATAEETKVADTFKKDGFALLPPPAEMSKEQLQTLKAKVDRLFANRNGSQKLTDGMYRLLDGLELIPEIIDFIDPELESVIEAYYGSYFKIFGVYFYHTESCATRPKSSFLWHADNCPGQEIKLMIYLDDVHADTGAIRLKTRSYSDDLKVRGFIERGRYASFLSELDNPATTAVVEGPVGTRLLFQNGSAIHKAVLPEREHRDVVTFVIIPSQLPWRVQFARTKHLLSTNTGICMDPWTDKPQTVGYRD